jgi:hypothetical protein
MRELPSLLIQTFTEPKRLHQISEQLVELRELLQILVRFFITKSKKYSFDIVGI